MSVRVPLDGVDAKLNIASKAPTEQRIKAKKMRGLKMPDLDVDFFFMDDEAELFPSAVNPEMVRKTLGEM